MPGISIASRRRSRPSVKSKINRQDPLASQLVSAWLPIAGYGAFDIAGGQHMGLQGSPVHGRNVFGYGMEATTGNYGARIICGTTGKLAIQPPLSIMWVGSFVGSPDGFGHLFGAIYDQADGSPYMCYAFASNFGGVIAFEWNDTGAFESQSSGTSAAAGVTAVIIATLTPSAGTIWVNGAVSGPTGGAGTINYGANSCVTFNWYGASRNPQSVSSFGAVWNRELQPGEVARLTADPFCFVNQ